MKNYEGDKRLKNVKNNIKSNKELTGFGDILDMILILFFDTTKNPEEVVIEICKLANEIHNLTEEQEDKLFWGLWLTTEIFIPDEKTLEKVRTMTLLNRSSINEILRKKEYEVEERGIEKGREEGIEEVASNMIQEGLPTSQISRITGLDVASIHQLTLEK